MQLIDYHPELSSTSTDFPTDGSVAMTDVVVAEIGKYLLCPICMHIIKDAFLTACGRSFCYMCIITHLHHKSDWPCCGHYLTNNQLFPNFLLDKLLKKTSAHQISTTASRITTGL